MAKLNSQKIRIATYDVNGLLYPVKRSKILSKLKKDKIDIELLQETFNGNRAWQVEKNWI